MGRIAETFTRLEKSGQKALIPYITCCDPNAELTLSLMHGMVESGADIIELGIPFSDPMADGPVIQKAHERALEAGDIGLLDVLEVVRSFRKKDSETPVVLMGYLNTLEVLGYQTAASACQEAGVDGVLMVDLPPEEHELMGCFGEAGIETVYLLSPTTTLERAKMICDQAGGYLYYVSLKGVTGSSSLDIDSVKSRLAQLETLTSLPIGVGFGISDAESAAQVAQIADGVIVGSKLVQQIETHAGDPDRIESSIVSILSGMRERMNACA